jgi:hypothetical protein
MVIRAVLLLLATLAFGLAPLITPPFRGYLPEIFPVVIPRPSIQPVSFAFAIWGPIYAGLILHAIYGLFARRDDPAWDHVRLPLAVSIIIGTAWLWIAPLFPITATLAIWVMAGAAIAALLRADPARDRWLLTLPIAMYAGWLTAAANVSLGVVVAGYGLLTDTESAAAMLAVALAIGVSVQLRRPRAPIYGLTLAWALFGIVWVNWTPNVTVAGIAAAGMAIMFITILGSMRQSRG